MKTPFLKMQAAGNDFVLIDEFAKVLVPEEEKEVFVVKVAKRHFGVGSDGVIFVQPSAQHDAKFVFYNPDGSVAEMCGNGVRCFVKYVYEHGLVRKEKIEIESLKGVLVAEPLVEDGVVRKVKVDMGAPFIRRAEIPVAGKADDLFVDQKVEVGGEKHRITAVGMGNPHAVIFVEDARKADVKGVGGKIRFHTNLFPNGVNVHFVEDLGENEFVIRTYERGVEDETLACGTGICASAVAAALTGAADKKKSVLFHALGGDVRIDLVFEGKEIVKVFMTGPVEEVFSGVV